MQSTIVTAVEEKTDATVAAIAGELAEGLGSQIVLAHIADDPALDSGVEYESEGAMRRARESFHRMGEELPEGVDVRQRVEVGAVVEELISIARDEDAELIVVGSRGRGALSSAVLGSVSRELTQRAPCPVVIVTLVAGRQRGDRSTGDGSATSSLVAGVDGSERAAAGARLAGALARRLGDRLVLVHSSGAEGGIPAVTKAEADAAAQLVIEGALTSAGVEADTRIEQGSAARALESVAHRVGARLIVVAAREIGPLRAALVGSVSAQLATHAGCPVVVLPERVDLRATNGRRRAAQGG